MTARRVAMSLVLVGLGLGGCFVDTPSESTSSANDGTDTVGPTGNGTDPGTAGSTAATSMGTGSTGPSADGTATDTVDPPTTGPVACPDDCFTGQCDEMGRCQRIVFATRGVYDAMFGTPEAADTICADEAKEAGLPLRFVALLATGGTVVSAFEHAEISLDPNAVFVLADADATPVGDVEHLRPDLNPMVDLVHPIDRDAGGGVLDETVGTACSNETSPFRVWTGLITDVGDVLAVGGACGAWDGTGANVGTGRLNLVAQGWIASVNCPCSIAGGAEARALARLYCVQVPEP